MSVFDHIKICHILIIIMFRQYSEILFKKKKKKKLPTESPEYGHDF